MCGKGHFIGADGKLLNVRFPPIADIRAAANMRAMTRLGPDPERWLPELRSVLTAMADALRGRAPSPALLVALLPEYRHCIPGSVVELEYFPDGYTDDPEFQPEYVVGLKGSFSPSWLLLESDLDRFVRKTAGLS